MSRTHFSPSPYRAFNLIEGAIVLGFIGLVIGGIWVASAAMKENLVTKELNEDIISICAAARNVFPPNLAPQLGGGSSGPNSDPIGQQLYLSKVLPGDWTPGAAAGQFVFPGAGPSSFVQARQFDLTFIGTTDFWLAGAVELQFINLSSAQCRRLARQLTVIYQRDPLQAPLANVEVNYSGGAARSGALDDPNLPSLTAADCLDASTNYLGVVCRAN